jgi:hypothetical protein
VTGTIVVREVHPPEQGEPVGRLDADLVLTDASLSGNVSVDYREHFAPICHDVTWPDVGTIPGGPR